MIAKNKIDPQAGDNKADKQYNIVKAAKDNAYDDVKNALGEDPSCINDQDASGLTALHWAAGNRNYQICELLLGRTNPAPDLWIKDRRNRMAVDHAIDGGSRKIIDLLSLATYGEF